jgi:POT family proton-dependent oligopeptide transporter
VNPGDATGSSSPARGETGSAAVAASDQELFGHPRGLTFLFATEMWERFSYYGMRALLVLYMVKYLFDPTRVETVIGFAAIRGALEWLFGPLEIQPLSSLIYGFYTGFVYSTPIIGGYLADRVLGQRRMVLIGASLMAIGHFTMAFEPLFLFALGFLILGNGAFKPNISTQVGALYAPGDPRRDRAFSIFYVGINLGAFLAPLVCGTLGEKAGWHYGFAAAGIGMTIGLCTYIYATRSLPLDARSATLAQSGSKPFGRDEWRAIGALIVLAVPVMLFWATYEQQGNTLVLWADNYTDRSIGSIFVVPTTWFQAINPFLIFAFTPLVLAFWRRQLAYGSEPSTVLKMAYGCFGNAAANLIMCAAALGVSGGGKASWLWLMAYFIVITAAELYISPTSLSLVTKIAPARALSMMMGFWLLTYTGGFVGGYLGSLWSDMAKSSFFLLLAAVAVAAGLAILGLSRPLKPMLRES